MRIYLDVSCLNRPFDDQSQRRVWLEAEAVVRILERCISGDWQHVSSSNAIDEIDAMPNPDRQARVRKLLPAHSDIMKLTAGEYDRAASLVAFGIKPADALHVAAAESLNADVLVSCDDRLCRTARRNRDKLLVRVLNPIEWLKEAGDAPDDG